MEESFEKYDSENEDDPEVYESSGEEWEDDSSERKRGNRRSSRRLGKRPKISHIEISSGTDEEEEEEEEEEKSQPKNGVPAKVPKIDTAESSPTVTSTVSNKNYLKRNPAPGTKIATVDFVNGGFLILKKELQSGDPNKRPCLWRIDGKALLQKYEPFEENGQVRHRNTSIYTGWSSLDKDLYSPVTVKVLQHQGNSMTVELNWEELKSIDIDSE